VDTSDHVAALQKLEPLLGAWSMEVSLPGTEGVEARVEFERLLGGSFLAQRWEVSHPDAPDGLAIIAFEPKSGAYTQHHFDSRAVVRVYSMEFDGGVWTLFRNWDDFTPLSFSQRFSGTFSDDGDVIEGRWETSHDNAQSWETDFELTYRRL
jgi:hypothetical protein